MKKSRISFYPGCCTPRVGSKLPNSILLFFFLVFYAQDSNLELGAKKHLISSDRFWEYFVPGKKKGAKMKMGNVGSCIAANMAISIILLNDYCMYSVERSGNQAKTFTNLR